MANQIIEFLKNNRQGMIIGGIVGAVAYFIWKGFVPSQMSVLQSSLSIQGLVDKLGITLEIKTLLFFVILGIIINLLFWRK